MTHSTGDGKLTDRGPSLSSGRPTPPTMVSCDSERAAEALCVFARVDVTGSPYDGRMARCTAPVTGPSHSKRRCGLPCTRRWLRVLPVVRSSRAVLLLVGLPVAEQRWRHQQRGRVHRRQNAAALVAEHLVRDLHARQVRALTPFAARSSCERQEPDLRDLFLCHAWDDRRGVATELHDLLEAEGVSVWFSEKDIVLGQPFMREIDRGLAKSRTGLVLVTPALLKRVDSRGVSDKELSELLARDLLIPVVHETTYDELRKVSPLLASRNGLNTADDSIARHCHQDRRASPRLGPGGCWSREATSLLTGPSAHAADRSSRSRRIPCPRRRRSRGNILFCMRIVHCCGDHQAAAVRPATFSDRRRGALRRSGRATLRRTALARRRRAFVWRRATLPRSHGCHASDSGLPMTCLCHPPDP